MFFLYKNKFLYSLYTVNKSVMVYQEQFEFLTKLDPHQGIKERNYIRM